MGNAEAHWSAWPNCNEMVTSGGTMWFDLKLKEGRCPTCPVPLPQDPGRMGTQPPFSVYYSSSELGTELPFSPGLEL